MKTLSRLLRSCALLPLLALPGAAAAQEKPPQKKESLGEVARRVREQKKAAPRAEGVWTNDTIPQAPGAAAAPAAPPAAAAPAPGEGVPSAAPAPPAAPTVDPELERERAEVEAELQAERAALERARRQLDLAQRESDLFRQQFFGTSGHERDTAGQARLGQLEAEIAAARAAAQQAEQRIEALEERLEGLDRAIGPRPAGPQSPEQQREAWAARVRPLREELQRIEADLARMRAEAAARNMTLYGVTAGGSMTAQLLQDLETRRSELQRQIAAIEDEARRAGVPPAWLR